MAITKRQGIDIVPHLLHTPLHQWHLSAGAKMMPFGGYDMPLQYAGIVHEHHATRTGCALFDTCHMGEIILHGPKAIPFLETMVSCPIDTLPQNRCRYGMLCNHDGGVIDDLIVYRLDTERVMLVVNAGTRPGDLSWLQTHMPTTGVTLEDISESTAKIDVQGPHSSTTLAAVLPQGLPNLKYYHFTTCHFHDQELTISRTGYTGELGYEFYGPADAVVALWDACISAGAEPAGLGARDTLRLEAGYPLYGHELEAKRPAYESGFTKSIDLSKAFLGRDALHSAPPAHRLIGIQLAGRRSARAGDRLVRPGTDEQIGVVTSGSFGPSVGFAVALGYCKTDFNPPEGTLDVVGTRIRLPAKIAPLPFYTEGSVRKKLDPQ